MWSERSKFHQPSILRFATDDFMDEFLNLVASRPERLPEWEAIRETWRGPAANPQPVSPQPSIAERMHRIRLGLAAISGTSAPLMNAENGNSSPDSQPIKLYQPAHQRFYLVTACLVCGLSGLPDRMLDSNLSERVTFVVRRLRPATGVSVPVSPIDNLDSFDEYALVSTPQGNRWQLLAGVDDPRVMALAPGEEQLPLFGVTYEMDCGRKRRLLAGMIPVGKREAYTSTPIVNDQGTVDVTLPDPRLGLLISDVIQPWRSLVERDAEVTKKYDTTDLGEIRAEVQAQMIARDEFNVNNSEDVTRRDNIANNIVDEYEQVQEDSKKQIQQGSWYILLDFADFLNQHLKRVWAALNGDLPADFGGAEQALLTELQNAELADKLVAIVGHRDQLEGATLAHDPSRGVALAYKTGGNISWSHTSSGNVSVGWPAPISLADFPDLVEQENPDNLENLIAEVLADSAAVSTPPALPLAAQQEASAINEPAWFIIRCVFERPNCITQPSQVFSAATQPFEIASYFDPEAPARPIRISLPLDTTPAGIRKFAKNTGFVISDVLACQMEKMGDITLGDLVLSVLPWPFHKDLPEPDTTACADPDETNGMICSLSIPIVTICAFILLIIMVTILDYFFRWIPYLMICFRLPGLKAKGSS